MSDKEYLESDESEGTCPNYFWYFVGSFGITLFIVLFLIAYLIMYCDHFIWSLRRNPNPSLKRQTKTGKRTNMGDTTKTTEGGEVSQQVSTNMPDVTT